MLENKDICKKCGGRCCKKSGCDYSPSDFTDLSFNALLEKLNEGKISIVAALRIEKLPNGSKYVNPFLYLRARNLNRDIIDLFSMKTTCSQLTEIGCKYNFDERPSYGKNLVPKDNGVCYPLKNPNLILEEWDSYQKVLSRIVKRMTGLTVEQKLRQDIENTVYNILIENFENVDPREIIDIRSCILELVQLYPEEYKRASMKSKQKVYTKV